MIRRESESFVRLKEERSRGYELGPTDGYQWIVGWRSTRHSIEPSLKPAYIAVNQLPFAYTDSYSHSGSPNDHGRSLTWLTSEDHTGHLTIQVDPSNSATERYLRDVYGEFQVSPFQNGRYRIAFTVPRRLRSDLDEYEKFVRQQWKLLRRISLDRFVDVSQEFRIEDLQPTVDYKLPQRIGLFTDFIQDEAYGLLRPPNIVTDPSFPRPLIADGHCLLYTLQQFGQDTVRIPLQNIHEAKGDIVIPETGKAHSLRDLRNAAYELSAGGIAVVSSLPVSLTIEEADRLENRLSGRYSPSSDMTSRQIWEKLWETKEVEPAPNAYANVLLQQLDRTDGHILDVGCGDGRDAIHFLKNGLRVIGIDIAQNALALAREQASPFESGRYRFLRVDLAQDEIPSGDYIAVYSHLALHFFDDPTTRLVFRKIAEVLSPNARFFVKVKSTKDARYGEGTLMGEYMFFDDRFRHFFTVDYLRELTEPFFEIISMREISHMYSNYEGSFIEAEMVRR